MSGYYDSEGDLKGTVAGNILRATGLDRRDKTPSAFILSAAGIGERSPIASNNDESGRSLNRRVEVKCQ